SFDRPEAGARALLDLVAEGLGLGAWCSQKRTGTETEQELRLRERIELVVSSAVQKSLEKGPAAAVKFLESQANVKPQDSGAVFAFLEEISRQLQLNNELESLLRALRGEYIEPGPGADIVQNPGVLPTGRNTHAINPYSVPSQVAFERAEIVAANLLDR